MANLPRFGRTWNRFSSLPRPGTAPRLDVPPPAAASEPEVYPPPPRTANVLQTSPIKERSPRIPSPVQQKSVLYQKTTSEKPAKTDHRASEYSSGKPQQKQTHQQQSDVINIKGENVGAVMHITQSSDATETHKKKPTVSYSSENEKDSNKSSSNMPGKSFMNSNFQGVNNSILYNSSLSHRDPGLHLAFTKKPTHADSVHDSRH
ncbi:uncharacterized protein LOC111785865 [Cucurbita pepo subsp. pepo]|uniref:uncharacterized protein LOC111785865 n=1 Tax=Cucurbita pepo subsp. pepo TaxID=3664 RepID=UPI000C9D685F|nr:uncharacterized protein LOC111785865 [Cucurbita pepo subsp. pepo]